MVQSLINSLSMSNRVIVFSSILVLFHTRLYRKDAHNPQEVKKLVAFGLETLVSRISVLLNQMGCFRYDP